LAMISLGSRFNSDLLAASIYAERAEIAETRLNAKLAETAVDVNWARRSWRSLR
jgi:hypothetical protein